MRDDISITWKNGNKWPLFDVSDIAHLSRSHAIHLFSRKISVVAKQGTTYIVNSDKLYDDYHTKGKRVVLFTSLQPNESSLDSVGFI